MSAASDALTVVLARRMMRRRETVVQLRGRDADPAEVARQARLAVEEALPGMVKRAVDALPKAKDGKSVDPAVVGVMIGKAVAKAVDAIPPPEDGKDADMEAIMAAISEAVLSAVAAAVSNIPPPVGIAAITFPGNDILITLTDGTEARQRLQKKGAALAAYPNVGEAISKAQFRQQDGHLLITLDSGQVIDAGTVPAMYDDFNGTPEYPQAQQVGGTGIVTFTLPGLPVNKVWIELVADNIDDVSVGTVRVDGGTPAANVGTLIHAGQTQPISCPPTNTVKVFAPVGKTVSMYAYRRA